MFNKISLLLITLCLVVFHHHATIHEALVYSAVDIHNGQWWRLFTGGLTHSNAWHLWLNIVAFWLIYSLFEYQKYSAKQLLTIFCFCHCTVNLAILWYSPDTLYYVGLSGTLHALFSLGATTYCFAGRLSGYSMLSAISIKILLEQANQPENNFINTLIDAPVHHNAHAYGWLIGIVCAILLCSRFNVHANGSLVQSFRQRSLLKTRLQRRTKERHTKERRTKVNLHQIHG